jgi:two-component system, NarL family, response regulator YdfI
MRSDAVSRMLVIAPTAPMRTRLETLAPEGSARVVASVGFSRGAWRRELHAARPDVLLVEGDAIELGPVLRELARTRHPPATVLLTDDPRGAWGGARRAGVRAVLPRTATAPEVNAAIEAAATGLIVLHPDVLARPRSDQDAAMPALRGVAPSALTAREMEILGMMAEGLGNKLIAARLGISKHTAKFHVAAILTKLQAGSRTEAVTLAIRNGLILV